MVFRAKTKNRSAKDITSFFGPERHFFWTKLAGRTLRKRKVVLGSAFVAANNEDDEGRGTRVLQNDVVNLQALRIA